MGCDLIAIVESAEVKAAVAVVWLDRSDRVLQAMVRNTKLCSLVISH